MARALIDIARLTAWKTASSVVLNVDIVNVNGIDNVDDSENMWKLCTSLPVVAIVVAAAAVVVVVVDIVFFAGDPWPTIPRWTIWYAIVLVNIVVDVIVVGHEHIQEMLGELFFDLTYNRHQLWQMNFFDNTLLGWTKSQARASPTFHY